jgi:hypothetical protein
MHIHTVFITLLGWPGGIILGNLLASVVWSSVFEWRLRKHHEKIKAHIEREVRKCLMK